MPFSSITVAAACPCHQKSCDHPKDLYDTANTLLCLSEQPPKVDKDVYEAAMCLMTLSQRSKTRARIRKYSNFEEYKEIASNNVGDMSTVLKRNPNMRRTFTGNVPENPSEKYLKSRQKNNEAAKKSRDKVKMAEFENKLKIEYYQQDNEDCRATLKEAIMELTILRKEVEFLKSLSDNFDVGR